MQLSLITVILSMAVAVFAQTDVDDPVKMDSAGIPLSPSPGSSQEGSANYGREYNPRDECQKIPIPGIPETSVH